MSTTGETRPGLSETHKMVIEESRPALRVRLSGLRGPCKPVAYGQRQTSGVVGAGDPKPYRSPVARG